MFAKPVTFLTVSILLLQSAAFAQEPGPSPPAPSPEEQAEAIARLNESLASERRHSRGTALFAGLGLTAAGIGLFVAARTESDTYEAAAASASTQDLRTDASDKAQTWDLVGYLGLATVAMGTVSLIRSAL